MNETAPTPPPARASRPRILLAAALIVVAALVAWHNSFDGPFVLDDLENIAANPSIRRLTALRQVLSPPTNSGVGGRPILNLSFAINYRLSRDAVGSYHVANLAIHVLAGLTLLGLVRRTLLTAALRERFGAHALQLATAVALLWTLHPIQTASVTYLSQRAESLMGLFYLLTLYCFVRAATSHPADENHPELPSLSPDVAHLIGDSEFERARLLWSFAAVVACALGMLTKEVMITAPLAVLLYDRTFLAGSFRAALREQRWLYVALALTWLPLPFIMTHAAERGIGSSRGVAWTTYAVTECRALLQYLKLSLWPRPLILDYGTSFLKTFWDAAPYLLVLVPLLAGTVLAVMRRPLVGFLCAWFFGILLPTSSVVPVAFSPFAENRLYLSLVAVATAVVLALHALAGKRTLLVALAPALLCGWLVEQRNRDYRTELGLWADTVEKCPDNPHARYNLGLALARAGRSAAAAAQWQAALRDEPVHPPAHENLANALVGFGRIGEALPHYEAALRQQPDFPLARANYGLVLLYLNRVDDAEVQLRIALKQGPNNPAALTNYGLVLERLGRGAEAIPLYERALLIDPNYGDAHHNLGVAQSRAGLVDDAIRHFTTVMRLRPESLEAQLNLARAYVQAKRFNDAFAQMQSTLAKFPKSPDAHLLLGNVLAMVGQLPAAAVEYERALELRPNFPDAQQNLQQVRARSPR